MVLNPVGAAGGEPAGVLPPLPPQAVSMSVPRQATHVRVKRQLELLIPIPCSLTCPDGGHIADAYQIRKAADVHHPFGVLVGLLSKTKNMFELTGDN